MPQGGYPCRGLVHRSGRAYDSRDVAQRQSKCELRGDDSKATERARYARGMRSGLTRTALLALTSLLSLAAGPDARPARAGGGEGSDLIGRPLPDWGDLRFVDPPSRRAPAHFKGRVLLIRFWTGGCPYCRVSSPTLTQWARRYRDRGLVVVGIYHPKPPGRVSDAVVRKTARAIGLDAILAVDEDWSALERLWLRGHERSFTSASLLVDRNGIVRAVHRGGYLNPQGAEQRTESQAFSAELSRLFPGSGSAPGE